MKMEISARDKKLLVYMLAVGIIAGAYFFGARPLLDKNMENSDKITYLESDLGNLNSIYNSRDDYTDKIAAEQLRIEEAMNKFPADLTQENTLMMVQDIENNTGAWITRVSFTEEKVLTEGGEAETPEEEIAMVEEELKETHTGEPAKLELANIKNISQSLSLDYFCNYNDFKKFLDYVENYSQRLFIENLSATYSADANEVSGSIILTQYAIRGTGKEVPKPDLSGISLGTDNIFTTLRGTTTTEIALPEAGEITAEGETAEAEEGSEENSEESEENKNKESRRETEEPAEVPEEPVALGGMDPNNSGRRQRAN